MSSTKWSITNRKYKSSANGKVSGKDGLRDCVLTVVHSVQVSLGLEAVVGEGGAALALWAAEPWLADAGAVGCVRAADHPHRVGNGAVRGKGACRPLAEHVIERSSAPVRLDIIPEVSAAAWQSDG